MSSASRLSCLPHYSTLKKLSDRSSVLDVIDAILVEVVREFAQEVDEEAAIDSTDLETTAGSAHFKARSGRMGTKYVKLSVCVMTGSLLAASVVASWGPRTGLVHRSQPASLGLRPPALAGLETINYISTEQVLPILQHFNISR